jgi:translation initiation factor 2 subunit 2
MNAHGEISEAAPADESRTTAEKHSTSTLDPIPIAFNLALMATPALTDPAVDEVTDLFAGLNKKKKKPKKATEDNEEVAPDATPAAEGDFDASALKKKKKKSSKPKTADTDTFDAKLAEKGIEDPDADQAAAVGTPNGTDAHAGDLDAGTGIWSHSSSAPISYPQLLSRFFTLLNQYNPDILSSGSKSYKVPPPQCLREGNKKTIFANIAEICKRMKRNDEHVTQFLFAELGTSGSVDGSKRLVIKGRFQQKQIENVLRRYIGQSTQFPSTLMNLY